jgi:hypothetical protein
MIRASVALPAGEVVVALAEAELLILQGVTALRVELPASPGLVLRPAPGQERRPVRALACLRRWAAHQQMLHQREACRTAANLNASVQSESLAPSGT